jgi:hypothetical protein
VTDPDYPSHFTDPETDTQEAPYWLWPGLTLFCMATCIGMVWGAWGWLWTCVSAMPLVPLAVLGVLVGAAAVFRRWWYVR